MNAESLECLRDLIDRAPRCQCGGNCRLLEHLAAQVVRIQIEEVGFEANCPHCNNPLTFHPSPSAYYECPECKKWFRVEPTGAVIELNPYPDQHETQTTLE